MPTFIEGDQTLSTVENKINEGKSAWLLTLVRCTVCEIIVETGQQLLGPESYKAQKALGLIIVNNGNVALRVAGSCEAHKDKD